MKYLSVKEIAEIWKVSERSVRNYCSTGKIPGAVLDGKTWKIPDDATKYIFETNTIGIENDVTVISPCLRDAIICSIRFESRKDLLKCWKRSWRLIAYRKCRL